MEMGAPKHPKNFERQAVLDDISGFQKWLGKQTNPTSVDDLYKVRLTRAEQLASVAQKDPYAKEAGR